MSNSTQSNITLYLVRHGQSTDNILPIFQASSSVLTERGINQANQAANQLMHMDPKVECIISSSLPRAKQTATIIANHLKLPFKVTDLLVERIGPGSIASKPYTDTTADNLWRKWEGQFYTAGESIDQSETYDELFNRAQKFLSDVVKNNNKATVAVTHGYFLRVLIALVLLREKPNGEMFESIQSSLNTSNGGITVLRYTQGFETGFDWRLETYNQPTSDK